MTKCRKKSFKRNCTKKTRTFQKNILLKLNKAGAPEAVSMMTECILLCVSPVVLQMEGSSFRFAFYGEGYTEGQDPSQGKPNAKIRTLVQGPGMGSPQTAGTHIDTVKVTVCRNCTSGLGLGLAVLP